MSPAAEPMTFDELSELYRVEMKSNAISTARPDLFRAMADLLTRLRIDYDKQMSIDPESVMCEGANQRRKKAERLCKDVVHVRTQKICQMAIRGAMGADNSLESLTSEERTYYNDVLSLSKGHLSEVDRIRGRRNTVTTHIDEIVRPEPAPAVEPVEEKPPEVEPPVEDPEPAAFPADAPANDVVFDEPPPEMFDDFPPEESFDDIPDTFDEPIQDPVPEQPVVSEADIPEQMPQTFNDELSTVVIRILEDLPPFVGPDRDYELSREDVVTLPKVMAEALVNAEKAVIVRPTL